MKENDSLTLRKKNIPNIIRRKTIKNFKPEDPKNFTFEDFIEILQYPKSDRNKTQKELLKNFFKENFYPKSSIELEKIKVDNERELKLNCFTRYLAIESHKANDILFNLGDEADKFYLILKGKITVKVPEIDKKFLTRYSFFEYLIDLLLKNDIGSIKFCIDKNKIESDNNDNDKLRSSFDSLNGFLEFAKNYLRIFFSKKIIKIKTKLELEMFYDKYQEVLRLLEFVENFDEINIFNKEKKHFIDYFREISDDEGDNFLEEIELFKKKEKMHKISKQNIMNKNERDKEKNNDGKDIYNETNTDKGNSSLSSYNDIDIEDLSDEAIDLKDINSYKNWKMKFIDKSRRRNNNNENNDEKVEDIFIKDVNDDKNKNLKDNEIYKNNFDFKDNENIINKNYYNRKSLQNLREKINKYKQSNKNINSNDESKNQNIPNIVKNEENTSNKTPTNKKEKLKMTKKEKNQNIKEIKELIIKKFQANKTKKEINNRYKIMYDNDSKLSYNLVKFFYLEMHEKEFFGDFGLDSVKLERKATIIIKEDSILGYIDRNVYNKFILKEKEKTKLKNCISLSKISFLNNILFHQFEKFYFKNFELKTFKKNEVILEQGKILDEIFFLKEGNLEYIINSNPFELQNLMNNLVEKFAMKSFKIEKEFEIRFNIENEIKKINDIDIRIFSHRNFKKEQVENLLKKKNINIASIKATSVFSVEPIYLETENFYKVIATEDTILYSLKISKLQEMLNNNVEVREEFFKLSISKVIFILMRLNDIKISMINVSNMKYGKSNINPLEFPKYNLHDFLHSCDLVKTCKNSLINYEKENQYQKLNFDLNKVDSKNNSSNFNSSNCNNSNIYYDTENSNINSSKFNSTEKNFFKENDNNKMSNMFNSFTAKKNPNEIINNNLIRENLNNNNNNNFERRRSKKFNTISVSILAKNNFQEELKKRKKLEENNNELKQMLLNITNNNINLIDNEISICSNKKEEKDIFSELNLDKLKTDEYSNEFTTNNNNENDNISYSTSSNDKVFNNNSNNTIKEKIFSKFNKNNNNKIINKINFEKEINFKENKNTSGSPKINCNGNNYISENDINSSNERDSFEIKRSSIIDFKRQESLNILNKIKNEEFKIINNINSSNNNKTNFNFADSNFYNNYNNNKNILKTFNNICSDKNQKDLKNKNLKDSNTDEESEQKENIKLNKALIKKEKALSITNDIVISDIVYENSNQFYMNKKINHKSNFASYNNNLANIDNNSNFNFKEKKILKLNFLHPIKNKESAEILIDHEVYSSIDKNNDKNRINLSNGFNFLNSFSNKNNNDDYLSKNFSSTNSNFLNKNLSKNFNEKRNSFLSINSSESLTNCNNGRNILNNFNRTSSKFSFTSSLEKNINIKENNYIKTNNNSKNFKDLRRNSINCNNNYKFFSQNKNNNMIKIDNSEISSDKDLIDIKKEKSLPKLILNNNNNENNIIKNDKINTLNLQNFLIPYSSIGKNCSKIRNIKNLRIRVIDSKAKKIFKKN